MFGGRIAKRIFDPSSGGSGTILNMANIKFMITIYTEILMKATDNVPAKERIISPNKIAINKFEAGPAIEIINSPHFLFDTLYGFHCTGFAQPKVKPANVVISGTIKEPKNSRCLKGFRVSLPCNLGVGSPRISAV
jgi:hypothetical protein